MKVCMLLMQFYPIVGGAEKQAQRVAERLISNGIDVMVVTARSDDDFKRFEYVNNIPVYRNYCLGIKKKDGKWMRGAGGFPYLPFYWISLFSLLAKKRKEYDIIHIFHGLEAAVIAVIVAKIFGKKTVLRLTNSGEYSNIDKLKKNYPILSRFMLKVIRKVDKVVNINSLIRDELVRNGFQRKNIINIPNGVDTSYFHPVDEVEKEVIKKNLGLPNKKIVIYVGWLSPKKDLYTLLKAWRDVNKSYEYAHLILVGDGPQRDSLKAYAIEAGISDSVTITGCWIENIKDYFASSDVFVLPSRAEGMSNALLEAMASGLPAVVSAIPGNIDFITDEYNGLLFEVGNHKQLSTAILRILQDKPLSGKLSLNARYTTEEMYSFEQVVLKHQVLYRRIV